MEELIVRTDWGNFKHNLDPATILHANEIMHFVRYMFYKSEMEFCGMAEIDRSVGETPDYDFLMSLSGRIDPTKLWLENKYITADYSLYDMEGNDEVVYLTRRDNNPYLGKSLSESEERQRSEQGPKKEEIGRVKNGDETLRISIRDLDLKKTSFESGYFDMIPNYQLLNPTQKQVAERLCGTGIDLEKIMEFLVDMKAGVRFHFLTPEYVRGIFNGTENFSYLEKDILIDKPHPIERSCTIGYGGFEPDFIDFYETIGKGYEIFLTNGLRVDNHSYVGLPVATRARSLELEAQIFNTSLENILDLERRILEKHEKDYGKGGL